MNIATYFDYNNHIVDYKHPYKKRRPTLKGNHYCAIGSELLIRLYELTANINFAGIYL